MLSRIVLPHVSMLTHFQQVAWCTRSDPCSMYEYTLAVHCCRTSAAQIRTFGQHNEQSERHLGALPLTQRDLLKFLGKAQLICQLEQISHGVRPRGEHKDEGGGVAGVLEGSCQVEWGWLCEAAA